MNPKNKYWGLLTSLDLFGCDKKKVTDPKEIENYVIELCQLIKMKRYKKPLIVHFGNDRKIAGYSLVQLIETSSVTGHFVDNNGSAYIDVFSCKKYSSKQVVEFTVNFFNAKGCNYNSLKRESSKSFFKKK